MERIAHCSCEPDCGATSKPCFECGQTLPLSEFYRHARMDDGHLNKCKECVKAYQRRLYRRKFDDPEWRESERARSRRKERRRRAAGKANKRRPELKRVAQQKVDKAVEQEKIDRPDECEECGHDFSEFRREAHHPDYSRPLHVIWLCSRCHGRKHRRYA